MIRFILGLIIVVLAYLFFKFIYLVFKVNKAGRDLGAKPEFKRPKKKSSIDKTKAVDADYEEIK